MKSLLKFLIIFVCLLNFSPVTVVAQGYELLEPLPYIQTSDGHTTVQAFIPGAIKLAIALAAALSVIMIMIGGIQYMTTDTLGTKANARQTIQNAIFGFVLTISAWLILFTLNPKLVEIDLSGVKDVRQGPNIAASSTGSSVGGTTWYSDQTVRDMLNKPPLNISVNKSNCAKVGDSNCTSVYDLSSNVINGLKSLRNGCTGCLIEITGGTEYWLHGNAKHEVNLNNSQHKPAKDGGRAVDLNANVTLTSYIKRVGRAMPEHTKTCSNGQVRLSYNLSGAVYTINDCSALSTGIHWHVSFP
jgi:hypothetical protein